jgi:hypothetical protein
MANIYVTESTQQLIEKVAEYDHRTKEGTIAFLCIQRIKEIEALGKPETTADVD